MSGSYRKAQARPKGVRGVLEHVLVQNLHRADAPAGEDGLQAPRDGLGFGEFGHRGTSYSSRTAVPAAVTMSIPFALPSTS